MSPDQEKARRRLREIEDSLTMLREQLGPPTGDPQDFGDAGQDIQAREERDAMIESLEGERAILREQVGDA